MGTPRRRHWRTYTVVPRPLGFWGRLMESHSAMEMFHGAALVLQPLEDIPEESLNAQATPPPSQQTQMIGFHADDYNLQAALDASYAMAEAAGTTTKSKNLAIIEAEELERIIKPLIGYEIGFKGSFREEFNKKDKEFKLKLVDYLINKYANVEESKSDTVWDKEIALLDEYQIFLVPEQLMRNLTQKPAALVSSQQIAEFRMHMQQQLEELKTDVLEDRVELTRPFDVLKLFERALDLEQRKQSFKEALATFLYNSKDLTRGEILDFFKSLKDRDKKSRYAFVHEQQGYSWWDGLRLFVKSNKNGESDKNFWHTRLFQDLVKLLKEKYLLLPKDLPAKRKAEEDAFIDYFRGNSPVHEDQTTMRQNWTP